MYETVIIPKGTLLFRATNSTYDIVKDFAGLPKGRGEFCLFPNFNVFFYPYPFVSESVGKYDYTCIYVLNNDIKLLKLIAPSPYSRDDRINAKGGIISCDEIKDFKGCTDYGKKYDPCINFEKVKDDAVVGMIAIAGLDAKTLKKLLANLEDEEENNNNNNDSKKRHREIYYNTYYQLYKDSRGMIGVPEIILYPRKTIVHEGIVEQITDYSEFMINNQELFNYNLFHIVKGADDLQVVMEELINNSFKVDDETYGVGINKETGFYQLLNLTDKSVPIDKDNDLEAKHKEFKFVSGTLEELDNLNNILFTKAINEWLEKNDDNAPLVLDDLDLLHVPDLPLNVKSLSLVGNKIKVLENLPENLQVLQIENNKIKQIKSLPNNLVSLKLSNNPIRELSNLPNTITHLYANNCSLVEIDRFPNNLIHLELKNNNLEALPDFPNKVKILDLEENPIISLPRIPRSVIVLKYDEPEELNANNI